MEVKEVKKLVSGILIVSIIIGLLLISAACGGEETSSGDLKKPQGRLRIATTTSLYDTGLWGHLEPMFEEEYNMEVENGWYMIGGCTSPANRMATNGSIDVVYGHSPYGYTRLSESDPLATGKGYWILFSNTSEGAELKVTSR